ncbi:MAG: flavodoxin family protein [Gaiellales bacterium]|mgnify:CR=1 FL=1|nr:flavodoxin family protein [Gaiellales bacterium]
MRAIAICGSPRRGGNTEQLLQHCLDRLAAGGVSGSLVRLAEKRVEHCTGCAVCKETADGSCAVDGDDFADIFHELTTADIVLVGSPVYFGSATPQLMALLDRAGYVSRAGGGLLSRKLGGPVVVARRAGQNFTYAQLLYWFMISDMVVPGSSYWNMAFGADPGDVQRDTEALTTLDRFCDNLLWLANRLK